MSSKTSKLVKILIKSLLLPIHVDQDGKVVCKIFSWRTFLHFLFIIGLNALFFWALMLLVPEINLVNSGQTPYEITTNNITFVISNLGIFFPITLSFGLNNMSQNSIFISGHSWPKGGGKNILGNILMK